MWAEACGSVLEIAEVCYNMRERAGACAGAEVVLDAPPRADLAKVLEHRRWTTDEGRASAGGDPKFAARVEAVRRLRQARGTRNATGEVKVAGVSQKKKVLKESEIDMSRAGDVCDGLLAGESPASARACRLIEGDTQFRMGWRTQGKPAKGRGGVAAKGPVRGGGPIARGRDYRGRGGRL